MEFCAPCTSQLLPSSVPCPTVQPGTCWCGSIPSQPEGGGECPAPRRQSGAVESAVTQPWLSAAAAAPLRQPARAHLSCQVPSQQDCSLLPAAPPLRVC